MNCAIRTQEKEWKEGGKEVTRNQWEKRKIMHILIFNIGSSTIKYELFRVKDLKSITKGLIDNVHKNHEAAIRKILPKLKKRGEIAAVGHRVVHGGKKFWKPTIITPKVILEIQALASLAPLHNPANLAGILACKKLLPGVKQIAVFDTAFHHTIPAIAKIYALPEKITKKFKIERYGFHGISHEYVALEAQKKLGKKRTHRMVTCHLGNGCSITAVLNGKSVDTSMGFTPLEGVPMGTRAGDLDPGILLFLLRHGFSEKKLDELLNHQSGFLGLSGISSDMRTLFYKAHFARNWRSQISRSFAAPPCGARAMLMQAKAAQFTLKFFAYRVAKYIASYAATLGGVDCLVFTGGIGENAWYLRKMILAKLKFLKFTTLVIKTHEEKEIVKQAIKLL